MFEFLFKRNEPAGPAASGPDTPARPADPAVPADALRRKARMLAEEALASSDAADEQALADFIAACDDAEARRIAAEAVQTRPVLAQVRQHVLHTDRRVARLMQSRLDQLDREERLAEGAQRCIAQAAALLDAPAPGATQVAELERAWQALSQQGEGPPAPLAQRFQNTFAALARRLRAQAELQRAVLDALADLRATESVATEEALAALLASAEAPSLPRRVLADVEAARAQAAAARKAKEVAAAAPAAVRAESRRPIEAAVPAEGPRPIEAAAPAESRRPNEAAAAAERPHPSEAAAPAESLRPIEAASPAEGLRTTEAATPAESLRPTEAASPAESPRPTEAASPAESPRPSAPAARVAPVGKPRPAPAAADDAAFAALLAELEAALDQGLLQQAERHDKRLRDLAAPPRHAARLAGLRAELARLSAWARWGGNVSREELARAAEDLAAQPADARELARRIAALRAHWKELDAHAGHAPKALWERFDAACTAAYAPAAAHFAALAQARKDNAEAARALIAQAEAHAGVADHKQQAAFVQQAEQAWRRLGPIDRKEKKTLDARFDAALDTLRAPLAEARRAEAARREGLIAQVEALRAGDRAAPDRLREIQASWQDGARQVPLARRDEQALWQRFRNACDAVFAQRRHAADEADGARRAALAEGVALCERLEGAEDIDAALRDARQQWQALGELPRAQAAALTQRYKNAVATLEARRADARNARARAQRKALDDRLALCVELDAALSEGAAIDAAAWRARWDALGADKSAAALARRFEAALAAVGDGRDVYVAGMRAGAARFDHDLLRLEIMTGKPSPPERQAARLQVQVEVLRQSLRDGAAGMAAAALRDTLYATPNPDMTAAARLREASGALEGRA